MSKFQQQRLPQERPHQLQTPADLARANRQALLKADPYLGRPRTRTFLELVNQTAELKPLAKNPRRKNSKK